jgi:hypothetical protein
MDHGSWPSERCQRRWPQNQTVTLQLRQAQSVWPALESEIQLRSGSNSEVDGTKRVSGDLCLLRIKSFHPSGFTMVVKTTFDVFTRVSPDDSLERLTERSVRLVTDRPSNVDELFVTLL